jgi:hypothetical protein
VCVSDDIIHNKSKAVHFPTIIVIQEAVSSVSNISESSSIDSTIIYLLLSQAVGLREVQLTKGSSLSICGVAHNHSTCRRACQNDLIVLGFFGNDSHNVIE